MGFWLIVLAQMSNTYSDSEQSYNLDDSQFNYISGYVIEVESQARKMGVEDLRNGYLHFTASISLFWPI